MSDITLDLSPGPTIPGIAVGGTDVEALTGAQVSAITNTVYEIEWRQASSSTPVTISNNSEAKVGSIFDSTTTYPASPTSFTWDTDHWTINETGIYVMTWYVALPTDPGSGGQPGWGYGFWWENAGGTQISPGALTRYAAAPSQIPSLNGVDGSGNWYAGAALVPQLYVAGEVFSPAILLQNLSVASLDTQYGEAVIVRIG